MSRQIRRVPKGWKHPRNGGGDGFFPMYDQVFEDALEEWGQSREDCIDEHEWHHSYPDKEQYRQAWISAPCYQIYEEVSEGTPVSPVFETEAEMQAWLIAQGYSEVAADGFIKDTWAPSMATWGGNIYTDIHSCEIPKGKQTEPPGDDGPELSTES